YEAVLDTIGEGVITLDDEDYVITANAPARRLLGLSDHPLDRIHLPAFIEQHWSVEKGAIGRSTEARILWQDYGVSLPVALDWTSRELPGSAATHATWTVVVRDSTDAWERDQALGRLTRTLGHKLRTPLTGLSTGLEILAETVDLDEDGTAMVEMAQDSAVRLRDTLIRIIDFTIASTEGPQRRAQEALHLSDLAGQIGLDADVEIEQRLSGSVSADLAIVRRGVQELVANARSSGARRVRLTVTGNPDGTATFAVTDDGRGLPPGITERIFEPFYQTDRSGEGLGAGLGLAILAAEVERCGGSVGARSPIDGNTTVWFRIPTTTPSRTV
ncbi:MAG: PAS domain-containing sensor histidine kinase, partial [Acidimicrobiia bacterium]|nr:PAS domain-containing sensor histidine kinase [Acidimicrobiia bacterium]